MTDPTPKPSISSDPVTITIGSGQSAHFDAQMLVRDAEDVRRAATLASARAEYDQLFTNHRAYQDRLAVLGTTVVCPAVDLTAKLDELASHWFAPEVSGAIYRQIDQLSAGLGAEAQSITEQISANAASLDDPANPTLVILRERIKGLEERVDDATDEVRSMYKDLTAAQAQVKNWIEGMERTVQAFAAGGLTQSGPSQTCITYCRKVNLSGRGQGYLTLAGSQLIFQPVQTSGMLFFKKDQVGPPEIFEIAGGLTLTDIRQPMFGDHGVTLRQGGPGGPAFQLTMGRESLEDLVSAAG